MAKQKSRKAATKKKPRNKSAHAKAKRLHKKKRMLRAKRTKG